MASQHTLIEKTHTYYKYMYMYRYTYNVQSRDIRRIGVVIDLHKLYREECGSWYVHVYTCTCTCTCAMLIAMLIDEHMCY